MIIYKSKMVNQIESNNKTKKNSPINIFHNTGNNNNHVDQNFHLYGSTKKTGKSKIKMKSSLFHRHRKSLLNNLGFNVTPMGYDNGEYRGDHNTNKNNYKISDIYKKNYGTNVKTITKETTITNKGHSSHRIMFKRNDLINNGVDFDGTINKMSLWTRYCNSTTVHGFKYISDQNVHWMERYIWIIIISTAYIGILYISYLLQIRFSTNRLATVVESTFFPIYEIPYPAVTICNNNRINWNRVHSTLDLFLPNGTIETKDKLLEVLIGLNAFEFGSFEEFRNIVNISVRDLDHINITDLYRMTKLTCEEMFSERCWWRNKYINCCSVFSEQKSEYGMCYSFNSGSSLLGRQKFGKEKNYPWRTSSFGDWSGLRLDIHVTHNTRIPDIENELGIIVIIHNPLEWPNSGYFIQAATKTRIVIKPSYSYATTDVTRLAVDQRQCIFPQDDLRNLKYRTLPGLGLRYLRSNCLSECRQWHMVANCNCTLDFIYPVGNYRQCIINDLKCLFQYDDVFNFEKPPTGTKYFSSNETGITCTCLPECERIEYGIEIAPTRKNRDDPTYNTVQLDVHFQTANMVKYRTGVVFNWMDLMVAFGGIAGLFLGASLISVAEAAVFITIFILSPLKTRFIDRKMVKKSITPIVNTVSEQVFVH